MTDRTDGAFTIADLVRTWDLVSFETLIDGEVSSHPLGDRAAGRLFYGADGTVSAFLSRPDRPWPSGVEFTSAAPEDRARAALGFVAYTGRFHLDGDRVVHRIHLSLYPEMVGTDLVRTARFEGPELILSTVPVRTPGGRMRNQRLRWTPFLTSTEESS